MAKQLSLQLRTWGGARKGAGRKPKGAKAGVSHLRRAKVTRHTPVHVTVRMAPSVPNLRSKQLAPVVIKALAAGSESFGFRLVHYSVQSNHCHFIIEAPSSAVLARGMKGLCVRLARAINRQRGVKGRVFADRYHEHVLRTPRETRLALAYVLNNFRKHNPAADRVAFDPLASSAAFDGWKGHAVANDDGARRGVSTVAARCWLLQAGWRKHGLISPREVPSYKPAAAVKKVAP